MNSNDFQLTTRRKMVGKSIVSAVISILFVWNAIRREANYFPHCSVRAELNLEFSSSNSDDAKNTIGGGYNREIDMKNVWHRTLAAISSGRFKTP